METQIRRTTTSTIQIEYRADMRQGGVGRSLWCHFYETRMWTFSSTPLRSARAPSGADCSPAFSTPGRIHDAAQIITITSALKTLIPRQKLIPYLTPRQKHDSLNPMVLGISWTVIDRSPRAELNQIRSKRWHSCRRAVPQ